MCIVCVVCIVCIVFYQRPEHTQRSLNDHWSLSQRTPKDHSEKSHRWPLVKIDGISGNWEHQRDPSIKVDRGQPSQFLQCFKLEIFHDSRRDSLAGDMIVSFVLSHPDGRNWLVLTGVMIEALSRICVCNSIFICVLISICICICTCKNYCPRQGWHNLRLVLISRFDPKSCP